MALRNILRPQRAPEILADGERVYAVGDIHGRLDLLQQLSRIIEEDVSGRGPARNRIVILGDFIDRGPDSAATIKVLMALSEQPNFVVLKGNHEASLVDGLRGDRVALDLWVDHGGDATLRSFGASEDEIFPADSRALLKNVRRIIPKPLWTWLARRPLSYRAGQYLFVHAGVRPGITFARQAESDLLWIREDFIESAEHHGAIIVHGHTVFDAVSVMPNRIGVDTGAYRTGRLSAVGLEGREQWILETKSKHS